MGLFGGSSTTPVSEWSDAKLLKELSKVGSRNIVSYGKLVQEAQRRGLRDPKTGKAY